MASRIVPWDRLVRYIPEGGAADALYGEPIIEDHETDSISDIAEQGRLKVTVMDGTDALNLRYTERTETVGKLLGPLTPHEVPIIRCIGLNYKTHILEAGRPLPTCPTVFTKPGPAVADHGEEIPIPKIAQDQCDYEGEFVVLIGKDAKNVSEDDALQYVAGYTAGNDVSTRDWQRDPNKAGPVPQWTFSKSFDKYAPLGPCLVAPHAIKGGAESLAIKTFVNGDLRQESNISDLHMGVSKLIAFCSQGQTLQRGSLIMTGTPGGVGLFMKPPTFLQDGDKVAVQIEGIGCLVNHVKFEN